MPEWIEAHKALVWWIGASSAVMFVGTLLVVPALVVRLPADYFAHEHRHHVPWADRHPFVRMVLLAVKNVLGAILVPVGIAMLVLPGQGLLTIVVGFILLDFPGKYALERRIVGWRPILRALNWLRERGDHPPLEVWREPSPRDAR